MRYTILNVLKKETRMQTTPVTKEDIASWKKIHVEFRPKLKPNRISGLALYSYLESGYPLLPLDDPRAKQVVSQNILQNECFSRELPPGEAPEPICCTILRTGNGESLYRAQDAVFSGCDIFVGIDLASGYFLVEGSSLLWDELYAHRGLNETDLENTYAVAEYIGCLRRFGLLEETVSV